ncbi:MAG TPA: type II secretion system protein, partial [Candidatus Paceibacterota bacterium]|nr:type II secretion system protein [Candidatus Paceibacterota bacterium]
INRDKIHFGFTLVEMLVTLSIIVIMSSILIVYSRNGEKVGQLNRATERLSFDVRRMASMSMQTKQFKDSSGNLHDVCG